MGHGVIFSADFDRGTAFNPFKGQKKTTSHTEIVGFVPFRFHHKMLKMEFILNADIDWIPNSTQPNITQSTYLVENSKFKLHAGRVLLMKQKPMKNFHFKLIFRYFLCTIFSAQLCSVRAKSYSRTAVCRFQKRTIGAKLVGKAKKETKSNKYHAQIHV